MPSDQLFSKMFIHSILYMEYFINNSTYKQYNIIYNYVLFTIYFTFFRKNKILSPVIKHIWPRVEHTKDKWDSWLENENLCLFFVSYKFKLLLWKAYFESIDKHMTCIQV